jgi:hypothetical protein
MPRTDLLEQSATRVELDQRSRDARLRQEHVERALGMREMPRQSLLRRFLRRFRSRVSFGGQIGSRSARGGASNEPGCRIPGEVGGGAGGSPGAPLAGWPSWPRVGSAGSLRPTESLRVIEGWHYRCAQRNLNSQILFDSKH